MQTFLPYRNFQKTAKALDRQRLGKQRVEAWQILQAITNKDYGWQNHPAVKMWRGYEVALSEYGIDVCKEWIDRGYKDTLLERFEDFFIQQDIPVEYPDWLGHEIFHSKHRGTLLYKNYEWYSQFGWTETPLYEYFWPVA
jgi:hypothetical protein